MGKAMKNVSNVSKVKESLFLINQKAKVQKVTEKRMGVFYIYVD